MMFRMGEQKDGVSRKESFVFSVTIKQFKRLTERGGLMAMRLGEMFVIGCVVRTAGELGMTKTKMVGEFEMFCALLF
jgi:hypothetical protein